jgi:hypothetical protein
MVLTTRCVTVFLQEYTSTQVYLMDSADGQNSGRQKLSIPTRLQVS